MRGSLGESTIFFHSVSEIWHSVREKYKNLWGLWVRAHAIIKNEGSLGDSDAEKGGLLSLTYASPPECDCPPRAKIKKIGMFLSPCMEIHV